MAHPSRSGGTDAHSVASVGPPGDDVAEFAESRVRAVGEGGVELLADDESVAREDVSVDGRSRETAELSFDAETAGEYDILVDGIDAGTLVVQDQPDESTTTPSEDEESTGSPADDENVTPLWPLGLVAAAVVLSGVVVYRRRIEESEADL